MKGLWFWQNKKEVKMNYASIRIFNFIIVVDNLIMPPNGVATDPSTAPLDKLGTSSGQARRPEFTRRSFR